MLTPSVPFPFWLSPTELTFSYVVTLQTLTGEQKGQHVIVIPDSLLEKRKLQKQKEALRGPKKKIDPERLMWKVPVFNRTWGW